MKKIILIAFFAFASFINSNAQCTKASTGFGNNTGIPMYNVSGNVEVVLNSATSISVSLGANFSTASGPDVRIFLVDRGNLTDSQLKTPMMFNARPKIEMGVNPAASNTYTKTIPAGMNISDFETVYFFCEQFNAFWDFGSFMPFTPNCAFLANDSFEKNNLNVYPNPVSTELIIENAEDLDLKIYNILGNEVLIEDLNSRATRKINTNNLASGIYFIEFTDANNKRLVKRFVKQ